MLKADQTETVLAQIYNAQFCHMVSLDAVLNLRSCRIFHFETLQDHRTLQLNHDFLLRIWLTFLEQVFSLTQSNGIP